MFRSKEEILAELDSTLDQLLVNIKAVHAVSPADLSEIEVQALHKTQESLLARFMHTSDLLKGKSKEAQQDNELLTLQEKLKKFGELNISFIEQVSLQLSDIGPLPKKKPRIGKNRKRLKIS
jgi:hypothetical protein